MKLKSIVAGALLAAASFGASADTIYAPVAFGSSFTNLEIGTIVIGSTSDIVGNVFAFDTVTSNPFPGFSYSLKLDTVSFTGAKVGSLVDTDLSATGFNLHNVAAGSYKVFATGTLLGDGQAKDVAFLGANYSVTAVPEPETYGMLLGGLALLGVVARRKANKAA